MITKDSIETAYSFLHQKQRIYVHSTLDWQKDDIEMAIAAYADDMSQELFEAISGGRADFLHDHKQFQERLNNVYSTAESIAPSRPSSKLSFINVENVVNPPQKPVTNTSLVAGDICPPSDRPDSNPIRKQPITFTAIVPQGKAANNHD